MKETKIWVEVGTKRKMKMKTLAFGLKIYIPKKRERERERESRIYEPNLPKSQSCIFTRGECE